MVNYLTYPIKKMNITQTYNGSYSHLKSSSGSPCDYPIDDNCGSNKQDGYFYCPCDEMVVKKIYGVNRSAGNTIWLESTNKVTTPTFTDYITLMIVHPEDNDLKNVYVGQKFQRMEIITKEGKDGKATGYHFHISVGKGKFKNTGWLLNNKNSWVINTTGGAVKPEKAFFVDRDFTIIKNSKGLQFQELNKTKNNITKFITANSLNVRKGPGLNFKIINTITKNTEIKVIDIKNNWLKIGNNQWISNNYTTETVPNKIIKTKTVTTNLNVRKTPNGKILRTSAPLPPKTIVSVLEEQNSWTKININRWVFSKYLE